MRKYTAILSWKCDQGCLHECRRSMPWYSFQRFKCFRGHYTFDLFCERRACDHQIIPVLRILNWVLCGEKSAQHIDWNFTCEQTAAWANAEVPVKWDKKINKHVSDVRTIKRVPDSNSYLIINVIDRIEPCFAHHLSPYVDDCVCECVDIGRYSMTLWR